MLALLFLILIPASAPLRAHSMSVSFVEITPSGSQARFRYRLPLVELDLLFLIDENLDGTYQPEEVEQAWPQIVRYLQQKVALQVNGEAISSDPREQRLWVDDEDHVFLDLLQSIQQPSEIERIDLSIQLFQELIPDHKTLVLVDSPAGSRQFALDRTHDAATWRPEETGFWVHFPRFLQLGIEHIFSGYDHILFLIGILLLGNTLLEIVKIVTSFTLAHSLTLALATLEILTPDVRLVEVIIAFSIAYIGLESLIQKPWTRTWQITFVFGLAHGFGFASVLREMQLSSTALVSSLFSFNVGVEVGQIIIAALVFPLLLVIRQYSWRMWVLRGVAAMICAFGVLWFFERLLAI